MIASGFSQHIFNITTEGEFNDLSLGIFNYQAEYNPVYKDFIDKLGVRPSAIRSVRDIPFLPVEFFRNHRIITGDHEPVTIFESSGTTGSDASRHYILDPALYEESFLKCFRYFFGEPAGYFFAALLPSYSERENSSLVYMVSRLVSESRDARSRFFLNDNKALIPALEKIKHEGGKGMLIGVSFALLELTEKYQADLSGIVVVETGGMKGRRKEITREELHSILKKAFNIGSVHSEYGMTELLSQAWSTGNGIFHTPPWMRVIIRDSYDPLTIINETGISGGINIIDLANINSCSFIATSDLGKLHKNGGFEVLGRFDNSEQRGCNLLIDQA